RMSNKKKKQSTTTEDYGSLRYRDVKGKEDFFDEIEYEVSSILLELSHPVVFSSDPPLPHKWGRTKKRSSSVLLHPPENSPEPVIKSLPKTEVGELGSTSSSSCLTGEAKKTSPQSVNKGLEEEFSTANQRSKLSSQLSASSCSVLKAETGLIRAQAGLLAQPIAEMRRLIDYQSLRHLQPSIFVDRTANVRDVETVTLRQQATHDNNLGRRGFDLNLPAEEEGTSRFVATTKAQAAAQARQRRLGLMRSKKLLYSR
ncbi:unnamed protein product, partial [Thlaspi arvense]